MTALTAVKLQITTFDEVDALSNYSSYTLSNTPFFIKPFWVDFTTYTQFSQYSIYWDFGDGTYHIGPSAQHVYTYPGSYDITATFYNLNNEPFTVNTTTDNTSARVTVQNALPDAVYIDNLLPSEQLGVYDLPAGKRSDNLKVKRYNSWQNDPFLVKNNYTVSLYASGSRSNFMSVSAYYTDKWAHLKAYFGFTKTYVTPDGVVTAKIVDNTETSAVSVYAERVKLNNDTVGLTFTNTPGNNTSFAGTTGSTLDNVFVSYVDQKPSVNSNELVFLYANFDTKGFLELTPRFQQYNIIDTEFNTLPYGYINFSTSVTYLKSSFNPAVKLAITSNGITVEGTEQTIGSLSGQLLNSFDIYPIKYSNTKIPFVITFKDNENYTTKCYPPITGVRTDGSDPTEVNTVSIGLYRYASQDPKSSYVGTSAYRLTDATFSANPKAPAFNFSGSYFSGLLELPHTANIVAITAAALIQDSPTLQPNAIYGFAGQPGIKNIKRFSKRPLYSNCNTTNTTLDYTGNVQTITTSQSSSVIISIAPLKSNGKTTVDKIWVADSDNDFIYIYNNIGELITTIDLSDTPTFNGELAPKIVNYLGSLNSASPSNIAIDSNGNAWITLYDAVSTIRINTNTLIVDAVAVPPYKNQALIDYTLYTSGSATLSGFVGENLLLPTCVDTDLNDNVFVGYSHPVSGFIIKYSSNGTLLSAMPLAPQLSIQELIIDKGNNICAVVKNLKNNNPDEFANNDFVYRWNSNDLSVMNGYPIEIPYAGSMTIDLNQNLWVNSSFTDIVKIDPYGNTSRFELQTRTQDTQYYQAIGSVACDAEGFIWIVHNYNGRLYFFPLDGTVPLSAAYYVNMPDIQLSAADGSQAFYNVFGDWTGIRWANKYSNIINPLPRIVRGTSNLFDITDTSPVINKINEGFDQSAAYKSYILQESLFDTPELWNNFIGQIVGDENSPPESLGKTVYEKIANLVNNNPDPDTCNIDALKSLFNQFGLTYYNFATEYPAGLKRVLDLLSISHSKLYGSPNLYTRNFGFSALDYKAGQNLGAEIPIETGTFIVGEPVITYEKFSEKYNLIANTIVPETDGRPVFVGQPYPLSGVNYDWGWGLVTGNQSQSGIDIKPYYMFYKFNNYAPKNMVDGVIDFNNPLTTITPTASSYIDWTKFGGTMERVISRALYGGLKIT
jgi:hypothetical protein